MAKAPTTDLSSVYCVILAGGEGTRLHELTRRECKPAVFFAGPRRIVDFTIANALRSGLPRIMVATQYKPETLHRHLASRWAQSLATNQLYVRQGAQASQDEYRGTASVLSVNMAEIDAYAPAEVIVLAADHVYSMDYGQMIERHRDSGGRATVAASTVPIHEAHHFGVLRTDADGKVVAFVEKPAHPPHIPGDPGTASVSMGIYVFDWKWLRRRLMDFVAAGTAADFGKDILPMAVGEGVAHAFIPGAPGQRPYWRDVGTLDALRLAQVDFLSGNAPCLLPDNVGAVRDMTLSPGNGSAERQTCIMLDGSVIMPGAEVASGSRLTNTLVAPGTIVSEPLVVGENPVEDARWFRVSEGGTVLVTTAMLSRRASARSLKRLMFTHRHPARAANTATTALPLLPKRTKEATR